MLPAKLKPGGVSDDPHRLVALVLLGPALAALFLSTRMRGGKVLALERHKYFEQETTNGPGRLQLAGLAHPHMAGGAKSTKETLQPRGQRRQGPSCSARLAARVASGSDCSPRAMRVAFRENQTSFW